MSQMQLLKQPLAPSDIVYTSDEIAKDIVEHFKPSGRILEPCKGEGAFLKHMPGAEWCEIQEGRDFFQWVDPVDWIVTNPPYSLFREFLRHALEVSRDVVFLIPFHNFFRNGGIMQFAWSHGWLVHLRNYGSGSKLGFPMGNPVGALHFRQGYQGSTTWSWHETALPSNNRVRRLGEKNGCLI